jgi:hypothetical protein
MSPRFDLFRTSRRTTASFLALSLGTAAACSGPHDEVGAARLAITQVPTDTRCIRITVTGTRQVTRAFTVTPGASATFTLGQLPLGLATFDGEAFPAVCAAVVAASVPGWVSDPVQATVTVSPPVDVVLQMRRNGRGSVSVDFVDDPVAGTPPDGGVDSGPVADGSSAPDGGGGGAVSFATEFASSGDADLWAAGFNGLTTTKLWDANEGDPGLGSLAFRVSGNSSATLGTMVARLLASGVDLSGRTVRVRVRLDRGASVSAALLLGSSGFQPPVLLGSARSLAASTFVALSPGVWTTVSIAVNNPAEVFPVFDGRDVVVLFLLIRTTATDDVWGHLDTVVVE